MTDPRNSIPSDQPRPMGQVQANGRKVALSSATVSKPGHIAGHVKHGGPGVAVSTTP